MATYPPGPETGPAAVERCPMWSKIVSSSTGGVVLKLLLVFRCQTAGSLHNTVVASVPGSGSSGVDSSDSNQC